MTLKEDLRRHYRELRDSLAAGEIQNRSRSLTSHLTSLPLLDRRQVYHCFIPREKGDEIDTYPIIHHLWSKKKTVVVPRIEGKGRMSARLFGPETPLISNRLGIPEPLPEVEILPDSRIELVFVPLLAFDRKGSRLGYGGGFYDRLYENCRKHTLWIGLSAFEAFEGELPAEKHDLRLDYAISPERIYEFPASSASS